MSTRETDLIGAFRFRIEIEGLSVGAFKACAGLKLETEILEYAEGGENTTTRKLIGQSKVGNVVLKGGLLDAELLWSWSHEALQAGGAPIRRHLSIIVCDDDGAERLRWNLFGAWPVRWELGELDAEQGQGLVEVLELAPERMSRG